MARAMLDYIKSIFIKVSFNPNLFSIEVKKAMQRFVTYAKGELKLFIRCLILNNPDLSHWSAYLV